MTIPAGSPAARLVVVGQVVGVHGIRGTLRIKSYCESAEAFRGFGRVLLGGTPSASDRHLVVRSVRQASKGVLLDLVGIDSCEAAEGLVGQKLLVSRDQLPQLPARQYYWADLEGLSVSTLDGKELGRIQHLSDFGAHPVMAVHDGERERLIPFVLDRVVHSVDLGQGRVLVDWDPDF